MKNEIIRSAYDSILPDGEAKARMLRNILSALSDAQPERTTNKMRKKSIKRGAFIIIAAALALALSVTALAYATDLFGFRALVRPGSVRVSVSYPQGVPDGVYDDLAVEISAEAAQMIKNNHLAWDEWIEARYTADPEYTATVEKFDLLRSYNWEGIGTVEHEDGSVTLEYGYMKEDGTWGKRTRDFSAEDYQEYKDFWEKYGGSWDFYDIGGEFFFYGRSELQQAKLEEIAAKYGLNLKMNITYLDRSDMGTEEILSTLYDATCSGDLFYEAPAGVDTGRYYEEGSFTVWWWTDLPNIGLTGRQAFCHSFCTKYSTLSGGTEYPFFEDDLDRFESRAHTCPDGTVVTILSDGGDAYIYAYLESFFFGENISYGGELTDADLDYIADSINYSVIGK